MRDGVNGLVVPAGDPELLVDVPGRRHALARRRPGPAAAPPGRGRGRGGRPAARRPGRGARGPVRGAGRGPAPADRARTGAARVLRRRHRGRAAPLPGAAPGRGARAGRGGERAALVPRSRPDPDRAGRRRRRPLPGARHRRGARPDRSAARTRPPGALRRRRPHLRPRPGRRDPGALAPAGRRGRAVARRRAALPHHLEAADVFVGSTDGSGRPTPRTVVPGLADRAVRQRRRRARGPDGRAGTPAGPAPGPAAHRVLQRHHDPRPRLAVRRPGGRRGARPPSRGRAVARRVGARGRGARPVRRRAPDAWASSPGTRLPRLLRAST